jgi:hypothetical protein
MKKPISEMTLPECIERLRDLSERDICMDALEYALADRIEELTRYSQWISITERMPTKEDADLGGLIEWWSGYYNQSIRMYWNPGSIGLPKDLTHWRSIAGPEGKR